MAIENLLEKLLRDRAAGTRVKRTVVQVAAKGTALPVRTKTSDTLSQTAFKMDRWAQRQGERLSTVKRDQLLLSDCHHALFDPHPELANTVAFKTRRDWFESLMRSDAYVSLHALTRFDIGASDVAAEQMANEYRDFVRTLPQGESGGCGDGATVQADIDLMRSIDRAANKAWQSTNAALDAAQALGVEPDENGKLDPNELARSFRIVRDDCRLREIFEMAGRFRCFARAAQRAKVKHGYDDMVGIQMAGHVPSLLSSELAKLTDADLELDLLRRLVEQQALCREYQGEQRQGMGPIIVYCDESSSMKDFNKITKAKALCLTLGWIARQQKRWIAFVSFTSRSEGARLCMPPGKWEQGKLINWVKSFERGGTELTCLLETLPSKYWTEFNTPRGKTDIVVITDGEVSADPQSIERFNLWKKKQNAKCFGLIVDQKPGALAYACDQYWMLGDFSLMEDGVQQILSI